MKKTFKSPHLFVAAILLSLPMCFLSRGPATAEEAAGAAGSAGGVPQEALKGKALEDLVRLSWAASGKGDYPELERIVNFGLQTYEQRALVEGSNLYELPPRARINDYKVMNDVATLYFIRAEAAKNQGKDKEAIELFQELIKKYPYAQAWDPSRGSYWSIAEKSQVTIDGLTGVTEQREEAERQKPWIFPQRAIPGKDQIIDYGKYGKFEGEGTEDYRYVMNSPAALAEAVGEGIFPNSSDVLKNPRMKILYQEGRMNGSYWNFVNVKDLEAAYFKWATATEEPGVKLFYTGLIFERSKMYLEAIKAYHALIVHFPRSVGMTYWQTPWYPAQAAVAKIKSLLNQHPELGLVYQGGRINIINGNDKDIKNVRFIVSPGEIVPAPPGPRIQLTKKEKAAQEKKMLGKPRRTLGGKKTKVVQYENGHWKMFVNGNPFFIKALTYAPTRIGESPDKGTLANWTTQDTNNNGKADGPYDAWVDKNRNNIQDADEPVVGDFRLMKEMGTNAIRLYHHFQPNKEVLRDLYKSYGIMVLMGDYLGKYATGSGADWATGTDYENPVHQANMMSSVEKMVKEYRNEPYIVFWVLGNENNYGNACNADQKPEAYYRFVNKVAKRIKELDPTRPVAICNGDTLFVEILAKEAPEIDIYGANVYRGDYGLGSFWNEVSSTVDRPAFPTEFGSPAYAKQTGMEEAEELQANFDKGNWLDIMANSAGEVDGEGNAIGGIAFEWLDEWFKNYEPSKHDTKADVIGPFPGGYYFEEWFGIVGQGDGSKSPFMRQLRKAYFMYKELWNK